MFSWLRGCSERKQGVFDHIASVQRLSLDPSETLVLTTDRALSRKAIEIITADVERLFPNNRCLVLEPVLN